MFASFNPHNSSQKKTILSLQCADEKAEAVEGATQHTHVTQQKKHKKCANRLFFVQKSQLFYQLAILFKMVIPPGIEPGIRP